jgi:hypothetical protein
MKDEDIMEQVREKRLFDKWGGGKGGVFIRGWNFKLWSDVDLALLVLDCTSVKCRWRLGHGDWLPDTRINFSVSATIVQLLLFGQGMHDPLANPRYSGLLLVTCQLPPCNFQSSRQIKGEAMRNTFLTIPTEVFFYHFGLVSNTLVLLSDIAR